MLKIKRNTPNHNDLKTIYSKKKKSFLLISFSIIKNFKYIFNIIIKLNNFLRIIAKIQMIHISN